MEVEPSKQKGKDMGYCTQHCIGCDGHGPECLFEHTDTSGCEACNPRFVEALTKGGVTGMQAVETATDELLVRARAVRKQTEARDG